MFVVISTTKTGDSGDQRIALFKPRLSRLFSRLFIMDMDNRRSVQLIANNKTTITPLGLD